MKYESLLIGGDIVMRFRDRGADQEIRVSVTDGTPMLIDALIAVCRHHGDAARSFPQFSELSKAVREIE